MKSCLSFFALAILSVIPLQAQKIVIKGSDTLGAKLVPMIAEEYKAAKPSVTFEIAAEGSTTGITAIIEGTADIGMSSRIIRATERSVGVSKGISLKGKVVCYDGMAVIVSEKSMISNLTKRQVEQIFTGDVVDWSAVGGDAGTISIYTRNTSSGTYSDWKNLAMNKRDYALSSQKMAGSEQIAAEVAKNPQGIGYVGLAYIHLPGIKVVPIDGLTPTKSTILSKKYPYARPNYFYTNGEPRGEAARFINFMMSDAGQKIVEKVGFIPVK